MGHACDDLRACNHSNRTQPIHSRSVHPAHVCSLLDLSLQVVTAGKTNCLTRRLYDPSGERTVALIATAVWEKLKDN